MRLVISGYFGYGNVGDEALLSGMLTALRRAGSIDPVVLSGDPEATRSLHGVEAVSRNHPRVMWRVLRQADLLISGPGGLIQDRTSARSSLYYLGVIEMAYRAGVPVYLYAQGFGPLRRPWLKRAAGASLKRIRGAGVRDEASRNLLLEIGVPGERVTYTADAAFALSPADPQESAKTLAEVGIEKERQRLIGVVWRQPLADSRVDPQRFRQSAGDAIGHFARRLGAKVVVLPFHPAYDLTEVREFAAVVAGVGAEVVVLDEKAPEPPNPSRLLATVGGMDLMVCVRFHGLVFSALSGMPAVGIAYDPKVHHLAEELQVPRLLASNDLVGLSDALVQAWEERASLSGRMVARAEEFRKRAYEEGRRALAMAAGTGEVGSV